MKESYRAPRGTFDILPGQSFKWRWVTEQFNTISGLFNYREIVTPIFEPVELFERSVGGTSDIVAKEMYKFTDRKGRNFALRPEGTAPVVRSYIENRLDIEGNISKLFYSGPMFRYDRPQKGRYRQFYQYGIELIGSGNPYYDAEVILFADMFIRKLGITDYKLEINSIGCDKCSAAYNKALIAYFENYRTDLCRDCLSRIELNPMRLLDCKVQKCRDIAAEAPSILEYLDEDCREHFCKVCRYLDTLELKYTVNPRIVRGLDYYNRTAFEFIDTARETQNALLGGGRYDGLISSLNGPDTPAIGFAGGFERLIAAMEREKLPFGEPPSPDVYVVTMGEQASLQAVMLCAELRNQGIKVEFDIDKGSLKAQMKAAGKSNAKFALLLGDQEIANDKITIKDLKQGSQNSFQSKQAITYLTENTNGRVDRL